MGNAFESPTEVGKVGFIDANGVHLFTHRLNKKSQSSSGAIKKYQTPILIASKYLSGSVGTAHYESGKLPLDAGGISCFDTTDCAVEVKVRWLLGNGVATYHP